MTTLNETIRPELDIVIGQSRAKNVMSRSANSGDNGGEMSSCYINGEKGLGKTHLGNAYLDALCANNPNRKRLSLVPEQIRLIGPEFNDLAETIVAGEEYVLFLDEAQDLMEAPTKQTRTIFNFIRTALDGNNAGKIIPFGAEQSTVFDRKKHVICVATNYPEIFDPKGVIKSRMTDIELDYYTEKELAEIVNMTADRKELLFENGDDLETGPVGLIARCGRGTARFLERIFEQLVSFNTNVITMEHVLVVLRDLNVFPRGLDKKEIMLLNMLSRQPLKKAQFQTVSGASDTAIRRSVAYLSGPDIRFLSETASGFLEITTRGRKYLKRCAETGFDIGK